MEFYIENVKDYSEELTKAINKLLVQLNETAVPLNGQDVKDMISSSANKLFVARRTDNKEIVGMITLIVYRIPMWKKGWIEDVVVDKEYRGKGIATKLIGAAIESAKAEGLTSVNLTSRPQREIANKLYQRLGFEKRDTNVYWIKL